MNSEDDEQTPREKLRAKLAEKKRMRSGGNNNTNTNSDFWNKNEKVPGFRKQQEFGLKKRIKP